MTYVSRVVGCLSDEEGEVARVRLNGAVYEMRGGPGRPPLPEPGQRVHFILDDPLEETPPRLLAFANKYGIGILGTFERRDAALRSSRKEQAE